MIPNRFNTTSILFGTDPELPINTRRMKTASAITKGLVLGAVLITIAALTGCDGVSIVSPYGTAYTDAKGNVVIVPTTKPIVIPSK